MKVAEAYEIVKQLRDEGPMRGLVETLEGYDLATMESDGACRFYAENAAECAGLYAELKGIATTVESAADHGRVVCALGTAVIALNLALRLRVVELQVRRRVVDDGVTAAGWGAR